SRAHDPEKWTPVFGEDHAQKNKMSIALGSRALSAGYKIASFDQNGSTHSEGMARAREGERGPRGVVATQQTAGGGGGAARLDRAARQSGQQYPRSDGRDAGRGGHPRFRRGLVAGGGGAGRQYRSGPARRRGRSLQVRPEMAQ